MSSWLPLDALMQGEQDARSWHIELSNGRRFRVLNMVDDYSREMVGQLASVSISGRQVARFLSQLIEQRRKPAKVICGNGTEFTSKTMFFLSKETGIELGFIQPG